MRSTSTFPEAGNFLKTITLPTYNRSDYLKRFLGYLKSNDLDGYTLYCGIEKGCQEVVELCRDIDFVEKKLVFNDGVLGLRRNSHKILSEAFKDGSEFNVHLEDDLVLSPDCFNLANWYYEKFFDNRYKYFSFGFFNYESDPAYPNQLIEYPRFTGYGWCCFKENWFNWFDRWWFDDSLSVKWYNLLGWDWAIQGAIKEFNLKNLIPKYSRTNHLEAHGTNINPEYQDKTFSSIKWNQNQKVKDFEVFKGDIEKLLGVYEIQAKKICTSRYGVELPEATIVNAEKQFKGPMNNKLYYKITAECSKPNEFDPDIRKYVEFEKQEKKYLKILLMEKYYKLRGIMKKIILTFG